MMKTKKIWKVFEVCQGKIWGECYDVREDEEWEGDGNGYEQDEGDNDGNNVCLAIRICSHRTWWINHAYLWKRVGSGYRF